MYRVYEVYYRRNYMKEILETIPKKKLFRSDIRSCSLEDQFDRDQLSCRSRNFATPKSFMKAYHCSYFLLIWRFSCLVVCYFCNVLSFLIVYCICFGYSLCAVHSLRRFNSCSIAYVFM